MKTREIKFRNWYKVQEGRLYSHITPPKMIYLSFAQTIDSGCTLVFTDKERSWIDESDFEEPVLMQYTGLKDKNGKDIYEGDVCKYLMDETPFSDDEDLSNYKEFKGIVEFNDRKGWYHFIGLDYTPTLSNYTISQIEVIGNIYENPNLLV